MFALCPLQGTLSDSYASQSLLEFDGGIKVLIDVGWDESFDVEKLRELERCIPTLSLILLTHATISHLAAYAHCCKHYPLFTRIPVYATRPVIDLGRTLTQDLYASSPAAATTIPLPSLADPLVAIPTPVARAFLLQAPTTEEIAKYFSLIQPLKYSQPHQPIPSPFSPPLNGLTITAYNAGHTLGGTIWHIQHGLESVVYAVDWNQGRENVLAGAAWLGGAVGGGAEVIEQLRRPTALVCSSRGSDRAASSGSRSRRDDQLIETIRISLLRGGTVLIPVDPGARVLELAYLLEHAWRTDAATPHPNFASARLYLAGHGVAAAMRHVRSMLEWMDDSVVREFEAAAHHKPSSGTKQDVGPFDFRFLRLIQRRSQVERLIGDDKNHVDSGARVIIASDASLEWGFSNLLLRRLAQDPRNVVLLTEKPSLSREGAPSIARVLYDWWSNQTAVTTTDTGQSQDVDAIDLVQGAGRVASFHTATREALEGDELAVYQQWLATQRQLHATLGTAGAGALRGAADAADEDEDDASSDSSSTDADGSIVEQQGKALTVLATLGQTGRNKHVVLRDEDLGVNILTKRKGVYDYDTRGKKGRERAFPVVIRRRRLDDFGEPIRPEDYLRAEEREDAAAAAAADDDSDVRAGIGDRLDDGTNLGKKRRWDEAGGIGPGGGSGGRGNAVGAYKRRQLSSDQDPSRNVTDHDDEGWLLPDQVIEDDESDQGKDDPLATTGPSKLVTTTEDVEVHLRIGFVNFAGLHDRRSLHMLIPLIQPRKLILIAGGRDETMELANHCNKLLAASATATAKEKRLVRGANDVLTPAVGEYVNASVDTNAWVVRLADALVKQLRWQTVRGLSVVTLTAQLLALPAADAAAATTTVGAAVTVDEDDGHSVDSGSNKRQKTSVSVAADSAYASATIAASVPDGPAVVPTLDIVPAGRVSGAALPVHVGDLRLADLRRALQSAGHVAEFCGEGTLLVDTAVVVRKAAAGLVEVEGFAGRNVFCEVRRMIYENLAVVAGA